MKRLGPMALVGRNHDALHQPAHDVVDFERAADLAARMMATVRVHQGLALAAPQVGRVLRLVVTPRETFVNPRIIATNDESEEGAEACLSIPGRLYRVRRWTEVDVEAWTLDGNVSMLTAKGLAARMWQHEIDHLNGLILHGRYPEMRRSA